MHVADLSDLKKVAELVEMATAKNTTAFVKLRHELAQLIALSEVIREGAKRTNTLALNAAMEAARAGDSGLGFGAVAREVKIMATGAMSAVTEIEMQIASATAVAQETERAVEELQAVVAHGLAVVADMVG